MTDDDRAWLKDESPATQEIVRLTNEVARLKAENERQSIALNKINDIRNSIIGFQRIGWSEHIYPLVAALDEAGIEGAGYDRAYKYIATVLGELKTLRATQAELVEAGRDLAEAVASLWDEDEGLNDHGPEVIALNAAITKTEAKS